MSGVLCFGFGMTLRDGNREYYYQKLDELFPGLSSRYAVEFGQSYSVLSPNAAKLEAVFSRFCEDEKIECDADKIFSFMSEMERDKQTTLF